MPAASSPDDGSTVVDIPSTAAALLDDARARRGRAGHTLTPGAGVPLKQTLLALTAGTVLAEHESPGVVTLQVLTGSVRVNAGDHDIELGTGGYTAIPPTRHSVTSLADAVVLITVTHTAGRGD